MKRKLFLGQKVTLNKAMMNEPVGSIGFVYEEYGEDSVSIIFQNGSYDGFARNEQKWLDISEDKTIDKYAQYDFGNVGQVMNDYRKKFWVFK